MYLLDSDILTLLFREQERVMVRLAVVERSEVFIPIVAKLEIIRGRIEAVIKAADGLEVLRTQEGLFASEEFLDGFALAYLDETSADHFDRLRTGKKLKKIGRPDLLHLHRPGPQSHACDTQCEGLRQPPGTEGRELGGVTGSLLNPPVKSNVHPLGD